MTRFQGATSPTGMNTSNIPFRGLSKALHRMGSRLLTGITMKNIHNVAATNLNLPDLLDRFDASSREIIETALGEGYRIGRPWLGIEFLLIAMSKQVDSPLGHLLELLNVTPRAFRAELRGLVGIVADDGWRQLDAKNIGNQLLRNVFGKDGSQLFDSLLLHVSPRIIRVLKNAGELANDNKIEHSHLLNALTLEINSPAVQLLTVHALQSGWSIEDLNVWVARQSLAAKSARTPLLPNDESQDVNSLASDTLGS